MGRKYFDAALEAIHSFRRDSQPDWTPQTLAVIDQSFVDLPAQTDVVLNLSRTGRGHERLRLHLPHCADVLVSEMASFIDNPHEALPNGFVDGFIDRLCAVSAPTRRACGLPARVWNMMKSGDAATRTRLARLIQTAMSERQSGAAFVLVPLPVSDTTWVLVVVYFTGVVRVFTPHAAMLPHSVLRSVRHFVSVSMRLSVSAVEVTTLPQDRVQTQLSLLWSAVLVFDERHLSTTDLHSHYLPRFDIFSRAVLPFVLGLSSLIFVWQ